MLPLTAGGSCQFPSVERLREPGSAGCEYFEFCSRAVSICGDEMPEIRKDQGREIRCHLSAFRKIPEAFWTWLNQQKAVRNTRMDKTANLPETVWPQHHIVICRNIVNHSPKILLCL